MGVSVGSGIGRRGERKALSESLTVASFLPSSQPGPPLMVPLLPLGAVPAKHTAVQCHAPPHPTISLQISDRLHCSWLGGGGGEEAMVYGLGWEDACDEPSHLSQISAT